MLGQQQVATPQLGSFFAPGSVDFLGAQGQNMAAQQNAFNAANERNNAKTGALASLGGNAMKAFGTSDRRLKRNIKRIGATAAGLPLYLFQYLWSDKPEVGVMADEVLEVMPEAVAIGQGGYLMVDYGRIG